MRSLSEDATIARMRSLSNPPLKIALVFVALTLLATGCNSANQGQQAQQSKQSSVEPTSLDSGSIAPTHGGKKPSAKPGSKKARPKTPKPAASAIPSDVTPSPGQTVMRYPSHSPKPKSGYAPGDCTPKQITGTIRANKKSYPQGQTIIFTIVTKNASHKTCRVQSDCPPSVDVSDATGRPVWTSRPLGSCPARPARTLRPGAQATDTVRWNQKACLKASCTPSQVKSGQYRATGKIGVGPRYVPTNAVAFKIS
ncbi:MAG: hypothetical protein NVSMB57_04980 [Actinomycetota bacterium]